MYKVFEIHKAYCIYKMLSELLLMIMTLLCRRDLEGSGDCGGNVFAVFSSLHSIFVYFITYNFLYKPEELLLFILLLFPLSK